MMPIQNFGSSGTNFFTDFPFNIGTILVLPVMAYVDVFCLLAEKSDQQLGFPEVAALILGSGRS